MGENVAMRELKELLDSTKQDREALENQIKGKTKLLAQLEADVLDIEKAIEAVALTLPKVEGQLEVEV